MATESKSGLGYQRSIFGEPWAQRSLKWFLVGILGFALIIFPLYKVVTKGWSVLQGGSSVSDDYPVNVSSPGVQVSWEKPNVEMDVCENALSGIVYLPLDAQFNIDTVDPAAWLEVWFITPNGYKKYYVGGDDVSFSKTNIYRSAFRLRGKTGKVRIQIARKCEKQAARL